ncbi:SDR family oxidoreductase [Mycetocola spongiae]|uniref:SDR family oxidoreductase n=1 Tax=Mycetocola spongiae TaxID=2859226 RepID=UPI001CF28C6D|nr:NAD(P)H-binding protein [Mycetocola spongiae]UCR88902.1 SDR family oxidoreductase [Mycetocola spongiae]
MPSTTPVIAVTGSTGYLGGRVAELLSGQDVEQRLVVRSPGRAPRHNNASIVTASYGYTPEARDALRGVNVLFMVSAAESADRVAEQLGFIDAAEAAGVAHIVYTSFLGAAEDATFTLARDHFHTEQHLRASGMNYTILRDSLYLDGLPHLASAEGEIRGPAGEGRVSAVARDDVARAAVAVLTDPARHRGRVYNLTGREAPTLSEVAAILAAAGTQPVAFINETIEEAYASRAHYGVEPWREDAWVSTYTAIAAGEMALIDPILGELIGRPPLTLAEFLAPGTDRA